MGTILKGLLPYTVFIKVITGLCVIRGGGLPGVPNFLGSGYFVFFDFFLGSPSGPRRAKLTPGGPVIFNALWRKSKTTITYY